jgi:hypothetical protein
MDLKKKNILTALFLFLIAIGIYGYAIFQVVQ